MGNTLSIRPNINDFILDLKDENKNIGNRELHQIKNFFYRSLRLINTSTGNKEVYDNLIILSKNIMKTFRNVESYSLAFQVQSTAMGLIPNKNVVWKKLPFDVQNIIFSQVRESAAEIETFQIGDNPFNPILIKSWNSLNPLLLVSKKIRRNVLSMKNSWINANNIPLGKIGYESPKKATNYIIDHNLNSANLTGIYDFDDNDYDKLSTHCPQLKNLSIDGCSEEKLLEVLKKLPRLESLHCDRGNKEITKSTLLLNEIGKLTMLQRLSLHSNNGRFPEKKLAELLIRLPTLKQLSLNEIKSDELFDAIGTLSQLKELKLWLKISSDKLGEAIEKLTMLQSLIIQTGRQISDDKLGEAIGKLTMLENLDLCYSEFSSDKLGEAIGKLTRLQHLNFGHTQISGDNLAEAIGRLTMIQSLNLSRCKDISGDKIAKAIGNHSMLNNLNLENCNQIPGDVLANSLKMLTMLESLNLQGCKQFFGNELAGALESLTKLKRLNLSGCFGLSGDKIGESIGKLYMLQNLDLTSCKSISGDKLVNLLKKLTMLRSLDLRFCTQISGEQLVEIIEMLPNLHSLVLPWDKETWGKNEILNANQASILRMCNNFLHKKAENL